jgi:NADPH-dependent curcumin reductase CurA
MNPGALKRSSVTEGHQSITSNQATWFTVDRPVTMLVRRVMQAVDQWNSLCVTPLDFLWKRATMTATPMNRQWLLKRRPRADLVADDLQWVTSDIPRPRTGDFLVRNLFLSCDPTQRSWAAGDTYFKAIPIGDVMRSFAVGEIIESRDPRYAPHQLVQGLFGWQDYALSSQAAEFPIMPVPDGVAIETAMSVLGTTGITAYFGLLDIGAAKRGETLVVSSAAGSTGSIVGQIGKIIGCRVIGIAGGSDKCRYVTEELGFDAAIDYKSENLVTRLRELCPRGIDIYFDNVGGRVLDAALANLALHGRIVLCGAISTYNRSAAAVGPANYLKLLVMRGRMQGFVVVDFMPRAQEALDAIGSWVRQGLIRDRVDVRYGLENAPAVLARLFSGQNLGKQLLKIAEPASQQ